jgi:hypothetical protein
MGFLLLALSFQNSVGSGRPPGAPVRWFPGLAARRRGRR